MTDNNTAPAEEHIELSVSESEKKSIHDITHQHKRLFTEAEKLEFRMRIELLKQERKEAELERITLEEEKRNTSREAALVEECRKVNATLAEKRRNAQDRAFKKTRDSESKILLTKVTSIIQKHSSVLYLKYCRCQDHDEYGRSILNKTAWEKDINYFLSNVLPDELDEEEYEALHIDLIPQYFKDFINELMNSVEAEQKPQVVDSLKGTEFEILCADYLQSLGWHTSLTKGSGDQGIDIIARKENTVVVLQCKRYSGSVGNSAVQQVLGGKEMIKANFAAVVTNSTYTKSARQLAANSGVLLIHFDQLFQLDDFVSLKK